MLRHEFSALWTCKPCPGDRVFEIQTPYFTPTSKLVSVYIERRNDEWIVSDGGWLEDVDNAYDYEQYSDGDKRSSVLQFLAEQFDVQVTKGHSAKSIFYKKTTQDSLLAAKVSDVAAFISSTVSALHCSSVLLEDLRPRDQLFQTKASDFLRNRIKGVQFHHSFEGISNIKYNAVKRGTDYKYSVVTYVTGSNQYQYRAGLMKGIVATELLWQKYRTALSRTVALVDDECAGYDPAHQSELFLMLKEKSNGAEPTRWSARESLIEMIS
jgi:hypothetical protein